MASERDHASRDAVTAARAGTTLPEPPAPLRAAIAREVLAACGPARLLAVAAHWPAAAGTLPGLFHALACERPAVLALPGAGVLAALTELAPDRPGYTQDGERLDAAMWPVRRDAALALWAALRDPALHGRETARLLARWLAGDVDDATMIAGGRRAQWRWLAAIAPDVARLGQLLALMWPGVAPSDPAVLADLQAEVAGQSVDRLALEGHLGHAGQSAVAGWLAFDIHRRLPSTTAKAAAEVVRAMKIDADPGAWRELVLRAIELVAADESPGVATSPRPDAPPAAGPPTGAAPFAGAPALLVEGEAVRFILRAGEAVDIGRTTGDIRVVHDTVGRRHARLDYRTGVCLVSDIGSPGGTYHNDRHVHGERTVAPGDTIRIGQVVLTVRAL